MLRQPNVRGLTNAIAEKYALDANKITRVRSKNEFKIFNPFLGVQKAEARNSREHGRQYNPALLP